MNEREIIQAMEACRSGADDLHCDQLSEVAVAIAGDPALRRRYEQIQNWDQSIGRALRGVPVPAGLPDRLLAALAATADRSRLGLESAAVAVPLPETVSARVPAVGNRRRWAIVSAALASAALVFLALFVSGISRPVPEPTAEFAGEVIAWSEVTASRQDWRSDFASPELEGYRFDPALRATPRRWTWLRTPYHPATLVYDLTSPRDAPIYLYCLPAAARRSSLPGAPPEKPFSTTGGFTLGMWQRDDVVYVLSVQGGQRRYRSLIDSTVLLGRSDRPQPARVARPA
jgi:hypothetical protein